MAEAPFRSASWYQAATLEERLAALRRAAGTPSGDGLDRDRARERLRRWSSQPPFGNGLSMERRLALEGVREEELLTLLGEPAGTLRQRFGETPAWLENLARAFGRAQISPTPEPDSLGVIRPLLDQAAEEFDRGVRLLAGKYSELPFDPHTVGDLLAPALIDRLSAMLGRTLILELHVARLQGRLDGDTPQQRFGSFLRRLHRPDEALALLQEYPVLARQLAEGIGRWVAFSLEFLGHLGADWPALRAAFHPDGDPGPLSHVEGSAGDSHRGGRAVLVAHFASGLRLVYKPRPLAAEVHFQELLDWLNRHGARPAFRTVHVLDRGGHGWVEFIPSGDCASADEVRRFYRRQGGYLAILYALAASDFHSENVIACGEHPLLVDLEALFHRPAPAPASGPAEEALADSVLTVGLLPRRSFTEGGAAGIDLSGLGGDPGQQAPHAVLALEGDGTDEMRITHGPGEVKEDRHRPTLAGGPVDVLDYREDLAAGFAETYRLLLGHREELLAEGGPLARFAGDPVRFIARPSQVYALLLQAGFHPDRLRDALDRDRLYDRLWGAVRHTPALARLVSSERADLAGGDIPYFLTRPDSCDLHDAAGRRITDFFPETGLERARGRLRRMGDDDLDRQLALLHGSLATLPSAAERWPRISSGDIEERTIAPSEEFLDAARAVGDRLERLAWRRDGEAGWAGLMTLPSGQWHLDPLGPDLYDGLAGVALFLAYLGDVTGEGRYTALARAAFRAARRAFDQVPPGSLPVGAFSGRGGMIYALTHLGVLWDEPALLAEADAAAGLLLPLIEHDEDLDVIAGSAGCLLALLALHHTAPSGGPGVSPGAAALAAAVRCGDRLLACARPQDRGSAWVTRSTGPRALTGLAHGAAGIAWALWDLAGATGEERFREAARAGLEYERGLFSAAEGNWPDLRPNRADDFAVAWCHGAPGIGLARLGILRHEDDPATRVEVRTAVETTRARGFASNHTLCHGGLGNLELLLEAGRAPGGRDGSEESRRIGSRLLDSMRTGGWRCATPLGVESPGLMTGLAGIGYQMLRLAGPDRVPSVLRLAPPAAHSPPSSFSGGNARFAWYAGARLFPHG
jgi:type 2 lantibiotic biosynthesis protein LanM